MLTRNYLIRGRVQGVGFRAFTCHEAQKLNIAGWVRNLPDGSVECQAKAPEEILKKLEIKLRQGPALSRVDEIIIREVTLDDFPLPFEQRR